jgi:antitoxin component YwqK of YwqJK toxin-antitoxin module
MKTFLLISLLTALISAHAQKSDTLRKYLDDKLEFTSKAKSYYPALGIKQSDSWFLLAMYPDTTVLLKAYFKDKNFSVKHGPYLLYHPKNVKAIQGSYVSNIAEGPWRYWHSNGRLKDSGLLVNNVMCGLWQSWSASGTPVVSINYTKQPVSKPPRPVSRKNPTMLPDLSPYPGVKDGTAILYYPNGQMQDSGLYVLNLKSGLWKTWYDNRTLSSTGSYKDDSLSADWTFYRENGKKSTDETYKNGKLESMTCYDSAGNKESSFCSILKPPVPLGAFNNFSEYLLDNIFWPKELLNSNVEGAVKVEYVITKNGELKNFKIVESPHKLLSEEVTRFFSTLEKWSPAVSHNRLIDFQMHNEIPFYR